MINLGCELRHLWQVGGFATEPIVGAQAVGTNLVTEQRCARITEGKRMQRAPVGTGLEEARAVMGLRCYWNASPVLSVVSKSSPLG